MITGVWIDEVRGDRIAVQLDDDSIIITDYFTDPALTIDVVRLEGDGWREIGRA